MVAISGHLVPSILIAIVSFSCVGFCRIIHEFQTVDYDWPSNSMRNAYLSSGDYVPSLNIISGLAIDMHDLSLIATMYVSVPRFYSVKGVPSGLNVMSRKYGESVLKPYPDWGLHEVGNCSALQCPTGLTFDPSSGYLYVVDAGRVGVASQTPENKCAAKLVVFDTFNRDQVIAIYEFPENVASRTRSFLNNIALDYVDPEADTEPRYAYISDAGSDAIVVLDMQTKSSWRHTAHPSLQAQANLGFVVKDENFTVGHEIIGFSLAMSPTFGYIYYSPAGSEELYQVPAWVLRSQTADFSAHVRSVGKKRSLSGGMFFGHKSLYYGAVQRDAVYE